MRAQYLDLKGFAVKGESTASRDLEVVFSYNSPVVNARLYVVEARQELRAGGATYTHAGGIVRRF